MEPILIELFHTNSAKAMGMSLGWGKDGKPVRTGAPICMMARRLIAVGYDHATPCIVHRQGMISFERKPLGFWAGLNVVEGPNSKTPRFEKYDADWVRKAFGKAPKGS